jgi:hypothetical protein
MSNQTNFSVAETYCTLTVISSGVPNAMMLDYFVKGSNVATKVEMPFKLNVNKHRMALITFALGGTKHTGFQDKTGTLYTKVSRIADIEALASSCNDETKNVIDNLVGIHPVFDEDGNPVLDDNGQQVMEDRYEKLLEKCWNEAVLPRILDNKKKTLLNKIRKQFIAKFPSREQFLVAGVKVFYDVDPAVLRTIDPTTKAIIDASKEERNIGVSQALAASKFSDVLGHLATIRNAAMGSNNINGKTVNAYLAAVQQLEADNFDDLKLHEIDAFIKIASRVIDDPIEYVDRFINSWAWLYAQLKMYDYFPYDDFEMTRESLEEIVNDSAVNYSFTALTAN